VALRFGPFVLDLDTRQFRGPAGRVHLSPKAFELLALLITNRPKVVSKAALQDHLWPEMFVSEGNLSNLIAEVRAALADPAGAPRLISTSYGFGYAFSAEATVIAGGGAGSTSVTCWLEWDRRRYPLSAGANVVGRDRDIEVRLIASTVSRRHARLVVTADQTTLEDAGSKNGTFLAGRRITAPVPLADGDAIRIGSLLVTFRAPGIEVTDTDTIVAGCL
jgi:DNA-binding winged helix-turn-helix (wHTH) protein